MPRGQDKILPPLMTCLNCGEVFQPKRKAVTRPYCKDKIECVRAGNAAFMREQWRSKPETLRAYHRKFYNNHREEYREYQREWHTLTCYMCGSKRIDSSATAEKKRSPFLCGKCKAKIRRTASSKEPTPCLYCGNLTQYYVGSNPEGCEICNDRRITLQTVGDKVGVTRERVRQIAEKKYSYLPTRELRYHAVLEHYGYSSIDSERDPNWKKAVPTGRPKTVRSRVPTGRPRGRPKGSKNKSSTATLV